MLPKSPNNETHWNNSRTNHLYAQANASLDQATRCDIKREMMLIDFDEGGLIIPCFSGSNDAYSTKLKGYGQATSGSRSGTVRWILCGVADELAAPLLSHGAVPDAHLLRECG